MNVNKVIIAGRLTRNPEMKALPSGSTVTSFAVATSSSYSKDGSTIEETEYHDIVVFGKQAENCGAYLLKGQLVAVEGRLKTRSWDKERVKHYRTEILADRVQFGPKSEGSIHQRDDIETAAKAPDYPEEEINPEDIPF